MIPPIPPAVAAAGLKSAGSVTSSLIGRYRPAGVPRTGSREDRSAAYQRLLDASTRAFAYVYISAHMNREGGIAGRRFVKDQMGQAWEISADMIAALHGVRLCGTLPVIAAAEDLVNAAGDMNFGERDADTFQRDADTFVAEQKVFLDAARTDLGYDTRPWQLLRRRAERKFLRQQAAGTPALEA